MKKIKIESGVPVPRGGDTWNAIYPFDDMQVGDSFSVGESARNNVRMAVYRYNTANASKKFITRTVGASIRVWRVQ